MQRNLYKVERPIYSFETLKKDFPEETPSFHMINSMKNRMQFKKPSASSILRLILPLPYILSTFYTLKFFLFDVMSGFTMAIFHIPQGLAYGLLSGLKPVNGLYASLFPPLIYAFFGTSRQISIGTFSIMSLLSSVAVLRDTTMPLPNIFNDSVNSSDTQDLDADYELSKLQVSISTTLLAGILQVALGIFRFGFLMSFMSDALIDAFTSAAAVHVVMSQMSNMFGYKIKSFSGIGELPYKVYFFFKFIQEIHLATVIVSVICIVILVIFSDYVNPIFKKKLKFPLPIQFFVVVLATIISYYAQLNGRFGIKVVGPIPKGLPQIIVPSVTYWYKVLTDAILLAVIGFVMNSSLVKIYALKFSYDVNFNQEAIAYGMSNIFGSFFQCVMSAAALARTAVVVEVGMVSQVASLISCFLMLMVILFIGPLFVSVPKAVLSAIIIVSLKGLLKQITTLPKLWYLSKYDFAVWLVTYLATLFLNVPLGLVFGFIFSLLTILIRIQSPKSQILGQIPGTDIYRSIKLFKDAQEIAGIKIFSYDAPIYFANSEHFQSMIYKKIGVNPNNIVPDNKAKVPVKEVLTENHILMSIDLPEEVETQVIEIKPYTLRYIILDFSSVNYIDNVGIRILDDIFKAYNKMDIRIYLAGLNMNCREMFQRSNFAEENRNRISFITVHDAVLSTDCYLNENV